MSHTTHKVVVTNMSALKAKYDAAGTKKIESAVKKLIAADKRRGLTTVIVALDDAATMKNLKAPRVTATTPDPQTRSTPSSTSGRLTASIRLTRPTTSCCSARLMSSRTRI